MTTIRIPDIVGLVSQFRTGICPDYEEVLQAAEEWFARIDKLGALVFPLSDKKSLRLAIDLFILTYAYDNPFDEDVLMLDESAATKFTSTFVSAITNAESLHPAPGLPIIIAYRDFLDRLRADSTASGYKRCVDQIVEYAVATKKQIGMRVHHIYPTITDYVLHRRASGSVKPFLTILEISRRIDVPDSAIRHAIFQELLDISNDIVVWTNDIVSFNREQANGEYFNLVSIACIEKKIPVQWAIEYVFDKIESAIHRWLDLRAQIPKFDPITDEVLSKYVEGLEYLISGFVHWYWETDRYLGPKEFRSEVKNTLLKVLPLEPSYPQMPPDIKYNVIGF